MNNRNHHPYNFNTEEVKELATALQKKIAGEVRFDDGSRALYATDSSNYRQVPIGVVIPKSKQDVIETLALCREFKIPILSRGGGTSLAGQCCNAAVVIDFSKYLNRILKIDPEKKLAVVEPGCVLDTLRNEAEKYHLTFAPDPSTHDHNTLGGMIGNNSCGTHSLLALYEGNGCRTSDNVEALEILTYEGMQMQIGKTTENELTEIIQKDNQKAKIYSQLKNLQSQYQDLIRQRYPKILRRVSGYNLDELLPENHFNVARALVGSEGTCITILEATVKLVYSPPARSLLIFGFSDICEAGDHIPEISQFKPAACEGIDHLLIDFMKEKKLHSHDLDLLPEGKGWLIIEMRGENKAEADDKAHQLMAKFKKMANPPSMKLYDNSEEEKQIWAIREAGLGATANVPDQPLSWPGWEDSAVPLENVGRYLRELKKLFRKYNYHTSVYGHLGQGCIHCRIPFDLNTAYGLKKYRAFLNEAADLVISFGGSLSGEHGDGQCRAELLPKMFGPELVEAFSKFKSIWDPQGKMNPGKIVEPYSILDNLRIGTEYNPWNPVTHFKFPFDQGSFAKAALRCVGVGTCRRHQEGVMCPSYKATLEEKHSTRGRARLLFELLERKVIGKNKWRDPYVKQALDLCLSCKGCKSDCPVNVDMAKYKAEFFSHFYQHRIRPRSHYAFGLIFIWVRLLSQFPRFSNFINQKPVLNKIVKKIIGAAPKRSIPLLAKETFVAWFNKNYSSKNDSSQKIILWPDTFTNYFHPEVGIAAVNVLERMGFLVTLPKQKLCCGRPLYDFGFLTKAKKMLQEIISALRTEIRAGVPIVGLEPSCIATFRDELTDLFPQDEDAKRLKQQTFIFSEFLANMANCDNLPRLPRTALVQPHCHHHAIMTIAAERKILEKLEVSYKILETGCCGMAGSYGYEEGDKYQVSQTIAKKFLFPVISQAEENTLIIADGFSCRNQIFDTTSRKALHLAEVIAMAYRD